MTTSQATARPAPSLPWLIIICGCFIAALTFGPRSAMGFFQLPMLSEKGWDRTTFGLAMAVQNLFWGLGLPFFGAIADRFGTWKVLAMGGVIYAAGLYLMAVADSPTLLNVGGGILVGLGVAAGSFSIVLAAFARHTAPENRSIVFGIGTAAGSAGMFLFAPISQAMIDAFGWVQALLIMAVSMLTLHGRPQRLAALMPVESELEAEALNAWRQLVHVLTHEIMNSLTPVASLSRTARDVVEEARPALPADVAADLGTALDAIGRRADSLAGFVATYRSLSNVPEARPERVRLAALFARLDALVGPDWRARGGDVAFTVEPASLELMADPGQLEQALINLLKNAFEATGTGGRARVGARLVRGARLRIEVDDDGPGVPDALAAHIFTPFFTTRKQGGGIGLAMVRQLVHGNGGTVRYACPVSRGARFVITF